MQVVARGLFEQREQRLRENGLRIHAEEHGLHAFDGDGRLLAQGHDDADDLARAKGDDDAHATSEDHAFGHRIGERLPERHGHGDVHEARAHAFASRSA
jgi:hypothetical protein